MPEAKPFVRRNPVSLTPGARTPIGLGRFSRTFELDALAQLGYGIDPRGVPVEALRTQMTNPAVYMAHRTMTGIIRRPNLYSLRGGTPRDRAVVYAWLWPLLPRLLGAGARGFAYGAVAQVLEWGRRTLRVEVEGDDEAGRKARKATAVEHTHFVRAYECHPDQTEAEPDETGDLARVWVSGQGYAAERSILWSWDPEFGEIVGQGALRRSWRSFCEHLILSALKDKYFERSVDAPRVSWSPAGSITHEGTVYTNQEYVGLLLEDLQGSGSANLPGARDAGGNKLYELDTLDIPDRADAWDIALNRLEADMTLAFLVASTLSGGLDDAGGAASRTLEGMLREHVEDVATYVCDHVQPIINTVHEVNARRRASGEVASDPPEFYATEVGKASARKVLQQVLALVTQAGRGEVSMRTDVPALLDKLGVPLRSRPPEFPDGWGGEPGSQDAGQPPGKPKDPASERDTRRDEAATDNGEEDTGAPRDEDGDPSPAGAP